MGKRCQNFKNFEEKKELLCPFFFDEFWLVENHSSYEKKNFLFSFAEFLNCRIRIRFLWVFSNTCVKRVSSLWGHVGHLHKHLIDFIGRS